PCLKFKRSKFASWEGGKAQRAPAQDSQLLNLALTILDGKNREDLLRKEFDGQGNVMMTRIQSREQLVKETERADCETLSAVGESLRSGSRHCRQNRRGLFTLEVVERVNDGK